MLGKLNCLGGPTNPSEWYYDRQEHFEEDQLANLVNDYNAIILQSLRQLNIETMKQNVHKGTLYLANLNDEERSLLKIDQALAIFLVDLAEQVIVNFYKLSAVFIQLLKSFLNEFGWDKLANYKRLSPLIDQTNQNAKDQNENDLPIFTSVKEPDYIPQFSNEFILEYLPLNCNLFSRQHAITLTEFLCTWLYNRRLTTYKINQ